ncbi:unnamed protein product, partial [Ectocarpus sp. 4 AP-2014]
RGLALPGPRQLPRRSPSDREKKDGGEFLTCDQNEWKNPGSCKVSLSLLKASKDHPHLCTLCLQDVGGKPSLGTSTGKTD